MTLEGLLAGAPADLTAAVVAAIAAYEAGREAPPAPKAHRGAWRQAGRLEAVQGRRVQARDDLLSRIPDRQGKRL